MEVKTPFYVIDTDKLYENLTGQIAQIRRESQCKVCIALKGFSFPPVLRMMSEHLDGACASGVYEAILGKKEIGKDVFTFSPAYKDEDIIDVAKNSTHVIFNSFGQYEKYSNAVKEYSCSCGIRINPECNTLPDGFRANPCVKYSRLGIPFKYMPNIENFGEGRIEGIHMHTMCEQFTDALEKNISVLIDKYDAYLKRIKWLNLGGGQLFTSKGYDLKKAIDLFNLLRSRYGIEVVLEPCTAIVNNCGYLVTSVVDILGMDIKTAIIDASAVCHMPDVSYNGWKHRIINADNAGAKKYDYKISGCSCYAADIWGDYSFDTPLSIGDKLVFGDAAMYSLVKTNFFNGLKCPSVAVYSKENGLKFLKEYNYDDFEIKQ